MTQRGNSVVFSLNSFDLRRVSTLCSQERWKGRILFSAGEKPALTLRLKKGEDPLKFARLMVEDYAGTEEGSSGQM